ncbi:MAG: PIN domain-containing protein [Methanoregula sp.]
MKKKFPEYYKPTDKELEELWENCIFIFDTSVILNFYQYSVKSRDEFLSILKKISNRIWIPYQVGKEYQSRRPHIIREQREKYLRIQEKIDEIKNKSITEIEKEKSVEYHPFINKNELKRKIEEAFSDLDSYLKNCENKYPDLTKRDIIGEEIDKLFEENVGEEYSPNKLKELYELGKKRYEQKIPPGFSDQQKGTEKQYADFVSWAQILEFAELKNKSVIFVNDDEKNDWWLIHDYQKPTQEIILPHPDLIKEFASATKNRIYMYNSENFMKAYQKFLKEKVSNDAIKEVRNLRNQNRQQTIFGAYVPVFNQKDMDTLLEDEDFRKLFTNPEYIEIFKEMKDLSKIVSNPTILQSIERYENLRKRFIYLESLKVRQKEPGNQIETEENHKI